jgi:hypothetical protein
LFGGIRHLTHERNDIWIYKINKNEWHILEKAIRMRKIKKKKKKTKKYP